MANTNQDKFQNGQIARWTRHDGSDARVTVVDKYTGNVYRIRTDSGSWYHVTADNLRAP